MRIWKWNLSITDNQTLKMPVGAKILSAQVQRGNYCLWALCDDSKGVLSENREIAIYGTGNPIPDNPGKYISTFQLLDGDLVFHAFEVDNSDRG